MEVSLFDLAHLLVLKNRVAFLKFLALTQKIEVKSIAEIGVFFGKSAGSFRVLFPEAKLYLIDPWELSEEYLATGAPPSCKPEDYPEAFRTVTQLFAHDPNVQIFRSTSKDAVSLVPDKLDLVFIDGDHSYEAVKEDISLWSKKVRPGGILSGHDYDEVLFPQIVKAVDESLQNVRVGPDCTWFVVS